MKIKVYYGFKNLSASNIAPPASIHVCSNIKIYTRPGQKWVVPPAQPTRGKPLRGLYSGEPTAAEAQTSLRRGIRPYRRNKKANL
jgi:hypothetical protein